MKDHFTWKSNGMLQLIDLEKKEALYAISCVVLGKQFSYLAGKCKLFNTNI